MAKTCNTEGCNNPVFSTGFCSWHQSMRTDSKWLKSLAKKTNKPLAKKRTINPVSDKRLEELATYRPLRDKYLAEHPTCEVRGCGRKTTNLHHKKGRIGALLYDVKYFMACCELCHPKGIHENPEWARKNGYLI